MAPIKSLNTVADVIAAIDEEKQLDPGLISVSEKERFIQDALDDLGDLSVFEKVVTSTVTSSPVDLTTLGGSDTGYEKLVEVFWNDKLLDRVSPRQADMSVESDTPRGYWTVGSDLYLYPKLKAGSSGTLKVHMIYRPLDVPDLPREWRRLLVLYAVHRCHKKNGNTFASREYRSEYEEKKMVLFNKAIQNRNQNPTQNRDNNGPVDSALDSILRGL